MLHGEIILIIIESQHIIAAHETRTQLLLQVEVSRQPLCRGGLLGGASGLDCVHELQQFFVGEQDRRFLEIRALSDDTCTCA